MLLLTPSPVYPDSLVKAGETSPKLKHKHNQKEISRGGDHYINNYKVVKKLKNYKMTFYSLDSRCVGSNSKGVGKSGRKVKPFKSVAIDTSHIPLGTYLYISDYGIVRADDTGNKVKGKKIDLFTNWSYEKMINEGVKEVDVLVLERRDM